MACPPCAPLLHLWVPARPSLVRRPARGLGACPLCFFPHLFVTSSSRVQAPVTAEPSSCSFTPLLTLSLPPRTEAPEDRDSGQPSPFCVPEPGTGPAGRREGEGSPKLRPPPALRKDSVWMPPPPPYPEATQSLHEAAPVPRGRGGRGGAAPAAALLPQARREDPRGPGHPAGFRAPGQ